MLPNISVYTVKSKVESVLKAEVYDGQIYDICLAFLDEFSKIDASLSQIEKYESTNADSDEKIARLENRYWYLIGRLSALASETDVRLLAMSDYYKYKA